MFDFYFLLIFYSSTIFKFFIISTIFLLKLHYFHLIIPKGRGFTEVRFLLISYRLKVILLIKVFKLFNLHPKGRCFQLESYLVIIYPLNFREYAQTTFLALFRGRLESKFYN